MNTLVNIALLALTFLFIADTVRIVVQGRAYRRWLRAEAERIEAEVARIEAER